MKEFVYRKAEKKDIEGMVRLLGILFSKEKDFQFAPELHRKALEHIIDKSGKANLAITAFQKNSPELIGMMTVQTVVSTATGELSGWVEDVVIDPSFQGQGAGKGMLDFAEKWAVSSGITRLQLLADRDNHSALRFYQLRGWTESNMIHRKKMIST